MVNTARDTSLHKSPFWLLGASSRDDRQRIVQRADDKSLELDHDLCQKARAELTNPRTRLTAEIAWLPGVSPRKAEQLAARILTEPMAIDSGIPALAHLNLMTAAFETLDDRAQPKDIAVFIQEIASLIDELVVVNAGSRRSSRWGSRCPGLPTPSREGRPRDPQHAGEPR